MSRWVVSSFSWIFCYELAKFLMSLFLWHSYSGFQQFSRNKERWRWLSYYRKQNKTKKTWRILYGNKLKKEMDNVAPAGTFHITYPSHKMAPYFVSPSCSKVNQKSPEVVSVLNIYIITYDTYIGMVLSKLWSRSSILTGFIILGSKQKKRRRLVKLQIFT